MVAAQRARAVAVEARRIAEYERNERLPDAAAADMEAMAAEAEARDRSGRAEDGQR